MTCGFSKKKGLPSTSLFTQTGYTRIECHSPDALYK